MLHKIILFLFCLVFTSQASAKVLIITHAYNRPDFIEIQARTFKKFLLDDFEFVVYNDATSAEMSEAISSMCDKWHIQCIRVPQEIHEKHHPVDLWNEPLYIYSKRHTECIQFSLETLGYNYDGVVALFDSDLFLIRYLSIESLMKKYEIVSLTRLSLDGSFTHLWPGLSFLKMNVLPNKYTLNYSCGVIDNHLVDTGGYTYQYLQSNPQVRVKSIGKFPFLVNYTAYDNLSTEQKKIKYRWLGFNQKEIKLLVQMPHAQSAGTENKINVGLPIEFAYNNHFLHYRGGSFGDSPRKSRLLHEFIEDILH